MKGASGLYEGSIVNTCGPSPLGELAKGTTCSTIPGRSPPFAEPTPGKRLPFEPPAIGNPSWAFVVVKPKSGPVGNPDAMPKLPKSPPPYGNATNGWVPVGQNIG